MLPEASAAARANVVVVGLTSMVAAAVALGLDGGASRFRLYAADGTVLMEVTAIEFRGRDLALKGKMMRALGCPLDAVTAMPTVAYIRPGRRVG